VLFGLVLFSENENDVLTVFVVVGFTVDNVVDFISPVDIAIMDVALVRLVVVVIVLMGVVFVVDVVVKEKHSIFSASLFKILKLSIAKREPEFIFTSMFI
jgi:hypothetical protein